MSQLSTLTQNQIQKLIQQILLHNDLFELMSLPEHEATKQKIEATVDEIQLQLDEVISSNQLNSGVSVISQRVQQLNLILGKNLQTLDGIISTLSRAIENSRRRRRRSLQSEQQSYDLLKQTQLTQ